jgi:ketosteroid isomerase-like protein
MLVAIFLSGVLGAQEPTVQLPADLARVLTDYQKAWGARDASALVSLFAEDGFVLPSGRPPIRGREAIARYYQRHGGPLYLRAIAYATEGSVGYILGAYRGEESGADDGKFTLTLKKDPSGRWWIFSDMDNGNRASR